MPVKCNYAIRPRGIRFCIEEPHGRVTFDATPIDEDVDEVMGTQQPAMVSKAKDDAERWVTELLSEGELPVKEIQQAAEQAGHSWPTIQRVAGKGGPVSKHKSGADGQWCWSLRHDPAP